MSELDEKVLGLQRRILDLETRVGDIKYSKVAPLPLNATTQDIIFKINELIKILNTRLS